MLISQITESTMQQLITISVESRHTINMYNNTSYMFPYLCNYKAAYTQNCKSLIYSGHYFLLKTVLFGRNTQQCFPFVLDLYDMLITRQTVDPFPEAETKARHQSESLSQSHKNLTIFMGYLIFFPILSLFPHPPKKGEIILPSTSIEGIQCTNSLAESQLIDLQINNQYWMLFSFPTSISVGLSLIYLE